MQSSGIKNRRLQLPSVMLSINEQGLTKINLYDFQNISRLSQEGQSVLCVCGPHMNKIYLAHHQQVGQVWSLFMRKASQSDFFKAFRELQYRLITCKVFSPTLHLDFFKAEKPSFPDILTFLLNEGEAKGRRSD